MIFHPLRIAGRNMLRNRMQTVISLLSLILGLTFFFLISLWVKDEQSYDSGFPSLDRLGRVETTTTLADGSTGALPTVGWPVGKALVSEYPDIEAFTYMRNWHPVIHVGDNRYYETSLYADEHFFQVFGYSLDEGIPSTALVQPHSLVISERLKEKYFGKEDRVLGKILMLNDTVPYTITGVFRPLSTPSHLQVDMLGSFSSLISTNPEGFGEEFSSGWYDVNVYNYVKLKRGATPASLTDKIKYLVERDGKAAVAATGMKSTLLVRPVSEIYLRSGMATGGGTLGNIKMVRLFTLIGLFILLIACLNFINISTARSVERAREIGIKKVLGSSRRSLVAQFLGESAVMCVLASLLAFLLVLPMLPLFNHVSGKNVTFSSLFSIGNLFLLGGIVLVIIPLSGLYPALVLSSYRPVTVLKGRFTHTGSGNLLRKALVVTQFAISIGFVVSTIVVWKQMSFMQSQALGFDKDNILLVNTERVPLQLFGGAAPFKAALLGHAGIVNVSACYAVPGRNGWNGQFAYPEGRSKEQGSIVEFILVDSDYIKTLGLHLAAGREFLAGDQDNLIINETAARMFGWANPGVALGKRLSTSGKDGKVIGVLKDYHQHSLEENIQPVVLGLGNAIDVIAIRYAGGDPRHLVATARETWNNLFPGYTFDYRFLDEDFQAQYKKEFNFESLFKVASALSIAIACLGLLGLAIYTARMRVKEIGIRKVLGASAFRIAGMLSSEMVFLILISMAIATPIAGFGMYSWLQDFAYRTHLEWWIFPLAGLMAVCIALVTVGFTTLRAARANPVDSLRVD